MAIVSTNLQLDGVAKFDEVIVRMAGDNEPVLVFRLGGKDMFTADTRQRPLVQGATLSVSGIDGSLPFKLCAA